MKIKKLTFSMALMLLLSILVIANPTKPLFINSFEEGVSVINFENPMAPQLIASYPSIIKSKNIPVFFDSKVTTFYKNDEYIIIGLKSGKVYFINLTNGNSEVFSLKDYPTQIKEYNGKIYVSVYKNEIIPFEIKENKVVKELRINSIGETYDFAFAGNYLYVADGIKGLAIYSKSNGIYKYMRHLKTGGDVQKIYIDGEHLYTLDGASGISIFDISFKLLPFLVKSVDTGGGANAILKHGNYLYVTDRWYGLEVYNLNDINSPAVNKNKKDKIQPIYRHYTLDTPIDLKIVDNDFLVVTDNWGGLEVYSLSNPAKPELVKIYNNHTDLQGLYVSGNYLYASDKKDGLIIFDISNPENPVEISSKKTLNLKFLPRRLEKTLNDAVNVFSKYNYAYIADRQNGFTIFDISNLKEPKVLSNYIDVKENNNVILGYTNNFIIEGNKAFIADGYKDLVILDITNKEKPQILSINRVTGRSMDVAKVNDYIFLATDDVGFEVFKFDGKAAERVKPKFRINGFAKDIEVSGDYAYVAVDWKYKLSNSTVIPAGNPGVYKINISNPENVSIEKVFSFNNQGVNKVRIFNNIGFAALGENGFVIFDTVNGNIISRVNTPGIVKDLFVKDDYLYVADGKNGLMIFNITNPGNPVFVKKIFWMTFGNIN
ncbi:hypothetical protein XO10_03215 [Marinitoga sp. 1135]|uniref:LVIVD repeat protein n=1 Tax=Marinitoga piezophila (strain DSM 14283 / JCM 11233 / KA3) TaxID=443254 RepID=H2J611_MARPK|nr:MULTISPECIES: hypothetical protein [Marinitoga]AEX85072.1 hypothetical protein Marpi_0633 [Marinitoga piezophila KA3]APT75579.1 hypothetical protein LN42_03615 [Marinitoga sp. 1137]NUU95287.1 hypothetical protein [Marinitoga sp. 1135]NUU97221.1 hypothetical protein [Marinitoga sp. 1138]